MTDSYRGGYAQALLDVIEILENNSVSLTHWKVFSKTAIRRMKSILSQMLDHRNDMIDRPTDVYWVWRKEDESITLKLMDNK